jgi:hypothetical protein
MHVKTKKSGTTSKGTPLGIERYVDRKTVLYARIKPQSKQWLNQNAKKANMSLSMFIDKIVDKAAGL